MLFSATDKNELRRYFKEKRKEAFSPERCDAVAERFFKLKELEIADCILLYASFGTEISTDALARKLLDMGKTVAYPRCGEGSLMTFHIIKDLDQLENSQCGKFSIREPDISLPQPEVTQNTLCVLPGLAFTASGARLGYGGGFYDRFLDVHHYVFKTALAFESQIAVQLPIMPHDVFADIIITEERMVICNE